MGAFLFVAGLCKGALDTFQRRRRTCFRYHPSSARELHASVLKEKPMACCQLLNIYCTDQRSGQYQTHHTPIRQHRYGLQPFQFSYKARWQLTTRLHDQPDPTRPGGQMEEGFWMKIPSIQNSKRRRWFPRQSVYRKPVRLWLELIPVSTASVLAVEPTVGLWALAGAAHSA